MSTPSANLLVLVGKDFACIKIVGRANFNLSVDFKTLVTGLQQKGFHCFVVELSECLLMDSTFLGVLAGLGLKMNQGEGDQMAHRLELRNPNPRVTELLDNLGVLHLFNISTGSTPPADAVERCAAGATTPSRSELTRACLEAHETLMKLNPDNVARFKEVTKFLAEDLQKLEKKT